MLWTMSWLETLLRMVIFRERMYDITATLTGSLAVRPGQSGLFMDTLLRDCCGRGCNGDLGGVSG
jgi:hypothetical protein